MKPLTDKINYDIRKALRAAGSLGGGNHFIEINTDKNNKKYLVIHSGSRKLGNETALYYQRKAEKYCREMREKNNKKLLTNERKKI